MGIGRVESPRGATVCALERSGESVARLHLRTGSYANWPVLARVAQCDLFIGVAADLGIAAFVPPGVPWHVLPIMIYAMGSSVTMPSATLLLLDLFPTMRGLASSLWLSITFRRGNMTVDDYLGSVSVGRQAAGGSAADRGWRGTRLPHCRRGPRG